MWKMIVKFLAGIVLEYLPDVAVWAIEQATDKAAGSDRAQQIIETVQLVAEDAAAVAKVMADGKVTDAEKSAISTRVSALAEDIKALL